MANFEHAPVQLVELDEPAADASKPVSGPPDPEPPVSGFHKSVTREYFESIVVTFIMALFGMTFIAQAVKVPTGSMLNTILVEDHLMVNKFLLSPHPTVLEWVLPYRSIRRGDIIVFKYPKNPEENYVKRVVGLPGDEISVRGTRVLINGEELLENRVFVESNLDAKADLLPAGPPIEVPGAAYSVFFSQTRADDDEPEESDGFDMTGSFHFGDRSRYGTDLPYSIPDGHYFCMGDNRDNSEDSRFWGPVPRENVVGRAMFVYWSIDESAREEAGPSGLLGDIFRYTRWGRTGTLLR